MAPDANIQQLKAAFASVSPFFWLFSLSGAVSPLSPLSWGYSTWLLFIIPLTITVFAPTRAFSGPLRFAYLEYATYLTSLLTAFFGTFVGFIQSLPTLALPIFFFIPVLPTLFFVLLPALPVAWHYVAYHYRFRLKKITTDATETTARLDLALTRARRAATLAQTYEKKVLDITSSTCRTASLTLALHNTDFFDKAVSAWAAVNHTTGHAEQVATAARDVVRSADEVRRSAVPGNEIRPGGLAEVLSKRSGDAETAALKAKQLALHARESVVWSEAAKNQAKEARQKVDREAKRISALGNKLANALAGVEGQVMAVENDVGKVRATLEVAVSTAIEGEMSAAETSMQNAKSSYENVSRRVDQLWTAVGEARQTWTELAVYIEN